MKIDLPLSSGEIARVRSHALSTWSHSPGAPYDDVARQVAASLFGLRFSGPAERLEDRDQVRFFAVVAAVGAARTEFVGKQGLRVLVHDLRAALELPRWPTG